MTGSVVCGKRGPNAAEAAAPAGAEVAAGALPGCGGGEAIIAMMATTSAALSSSLLRGGPARQLPTRSGYISASSGKREQHAGERLVPGAGKAAAARLAAAVALLAALAAASPAAAGDAAAGLELAGEDAALASAALWLAAARLAAWRSFLAMRLRSAESTLVEL